MLTVEAGTRRDADAIYAIYTAARIGLSVRRGSQLVILVVDFSLGPRRPGARSALT